MREKGIVSAAAREDERQFEAALRPQTACGLHRSAEIKGESGDCHRSGTPARRGARPRAPLRSAGLGKTTLATIIANELGDVLPTDFRPDTAEEARLTGILTTVTERQVFFIDEIHRLMPDIEEILYSALEDFHVDLVIGQGPGRVPTRCL